MFLLASCDDRPKHPDTLGKGEIDISVDETFRPVMELQGTVFDSSFPEAKVHIHYKPESECFKDYFARKARLILVTRELSAQEKAVCEQSKIFPTTLKLARDGIAVVLNNASPDTMLDMPTLQGILTGQSSKKYTVVFDDQGSSTVRFIIDSVLKGAPLGKNVYAAKGNKEVVDYVEKNPGAIGFVGLGYVSDTVDPNNTGAFINRVKIAAIKNEKTGEFLQPYQAYIALRSYPLTRSIYYINSESYPGLGTGFANFIAGQRGQLIFFHAHMFPVRSEMVIREAAIKN
ncbi:substrate-binding domain-containing protein [Nemorincola caseinilytica]|uniref:Substrate-binding domain-containing protein n=2 Tax=Nemorincola caseinilytica TaxID=2054315 RepID=A0ABP8N8I8_9BACT